MSDAGPYRMTLAFSCLCAASAAVLFTGCMPHVMHGPRIEDTGFSGSLSLTLGRNRELNELDTRILPSVYGGLRRSWVPEDGTGLAGSVGVQLPLLLAPLVAGDDHGFDALAASSYADVYIQPVRGAEPGFETGMGMLASTALGGPYLQVGMLRPGGSGWYTTHLVAFDRRDDLGTLYFPSFAWRHTNAAAGTAANLSAGLGFSFGGDTDLDTLIVLGVTLELGLGGN